MNICPTGACGIIHFRTGSSTGRVQQRPATNAPVRPSANQSDSENDRASRNPAAHSDRRGHRDRAVVVEQLQPRVARMSQPQVGVLLQATAEQPLNAWRRVGRELLPPRLVPQDRRQDVRDGLAVERRRAREHLEQHDAEGPDVGARIHGVPARLLRRHVGRGAEITPCAVIAGDATVGTVRRPLAPSASAPAASRGRSPAPSPAVGSDLDVRGLEIAVDDARRVRSLERVGNLLGNADRIIGGETPPDCSAGSHTADRCR